MLRQKLNQNISMDQNLFTYSDKYILIYNICSDREAVIIIQDVMKPIMTMRKKYL